MNYWQLIRISTECIILRDKIKELYALIGKFQFNSDDKVYINLMETIQECEIKININEKKIKKISC